MAPGTFIYGAPPTPLAPDSQPAPDARRTVSGPTASRPENGAPPRAPERDSAFIPDLDTGPEPITSYVEVFSPATGRKRFAAFDRVNADGSLEIADTTPNAAPRVAASEHGAPAAGRTRFTGDVRIRLSATEFVPIPSVAAGARLVSATSQPPAELTFAIDSAENWSVRANQSGLARLVYRLDAPDSYFGPTIAKEIDWSEIPATLRPVLPADLAADATLVLAATKISREQPFEYVVKALATYFRSFSAGQLSERASDSPYRRIALGRVGICRHRAYAFLITAHALGIPTRVVTNEAHVFVEVFAPKLGWVGIDLGGGAQAINEYGIAGRPLYEPPESSSFEWPSSGASTDSGTAQTVGDEAPATMYSALPAGPRPAPATAREPASTPAPAPATAPAAERPFVGIPARIDFTWDDVPRTAHPGTAIHVGGRVATETDEPVPRAFVALTASRPSDSAPLFTLGPFFSDPNGHVRAIAVIPLDAPPVAVEFSVRVTLP